MLKEYRSINNSATIEIVEKKSRFITVTEKISIEEDARLFIDGIKRKHRTASHNTYAYIVGKNVPLERCSDDGEPHGTAGRPILDVIQNNGLTDTIVVVTRYFGGTLLGTGGLARIYSKSALECIAKAGTIKYVPGWIMAVNTDYHCLGKIKSHIEKCGYNIINEAYTGRVIIKTMVPADETDLFIRKITDITNASATVECVEEKYIKMGV